MAKADVKTAIVADGLRYKAKASGSPFRASASFSGATMSCFLCGKHRVRSQMRTRQFLGKSQTSAHLPARRWTRQSRQRRKSLPKGYAVPGASCAQPSSARDVFELLLSYSLAL